MTETEQHSPAGVRNPESWQVKITETGGLITHLGKPRFIASWTTGLEDMSLLDGLFWTIEGSNEDDAITLYSFTWQDKPPDQATFETLMHEAGLVIDAYISSQL